MPQVYLNTTESPQVGDRVESEHSPTTNSLISGVVIVLGAGTMATIQYVRVWRNSGGVIVTSLADATVDLARCNRIEPAPPGRAAT